VLTILTFGRIIFGRLVHEVVVVVLVNRK